MLKESAKIWPSMDEPWGINPIQLSKDKAIHYHCKLPQDTS